jgi:hypothetical protein
MPLYYFDVRNGGHLSVDKDGHELADVASVYREAVATLGEIGRDVLRHPGYQCSSDRQLAIEVRSNAGPVLQVKLTFEMAIQPEFALRERAQERG